jgi:GAF domain-containing protein
MTSDPTRREATLRQYDILDTAPEQSFDDLTQLTSFICNTPIAMVSLLDTRRQWFKARIGVDDSETPIEQSFCAEAINHDGVFTVHDASQDEHFKNYPNVTGGPHIRFYAGSPLVSPEGVAIGTLCAIDRVPRQLSPEQSDALAALSRQVMRTMELRRTVNALQTALLEIAAAKKEIDDLQGILPMCCYCRKVRDDANYWQNVEDYLSNHTDMRFSHGFCPDCEARARQEMGLAPKK